MNNNTSTDHIEPIRGTFFLFKDGKVIDKCNAESVEQAYQELGSKVPFGFGKYILRDHRATGEIMIGSHVFQIKPLLI